MHCGAPHHPRPQHVGQRSVGVSGTAGLSASRARHPYRGDRARRRCSRHPRIRKADHPEAASCNVNADRHVIAIIPARGGSKRIPRKNLLPFAGKPLVVHSIEDALGARLVHRTIVSTDDVEIAAVSREAGAEVIDRPAALAGDTATSESALMHVLDVIQQRGEREPDLVVFLQCTSPEREPADIDAAIALLEKAGADSLLSATRSRRYLWHMEDGNAVPFNY